MARRTQNGLTLGREGFGAPAQRRDSRIPGSQERRALDPELPRTRQGERPTARDQDLRPGLEYECVCDRGWGVGVALDTRPPPQKKRLDIFSAWFHGRFRQLRPAAQAGEKGAVRPAGIRARTESPAAPLRS